VAAANPAHHNWRIKDKWKFALLGIILSVDCLKCTFRHTVICLLYSSDNSHPHFFILLKRWVQTLRAHGGDQPEPTVRLLCTLSNLCRFWRLCSLQFCGLTGIAQKLFLMFVAAQQYLNVIRHQLVSLQPRCRVNKLPLCMGFQSIQRAAIDIGLSIAR
jgi:hypothetical protein